MHKDNLKEILNKPEFKDIKYGFYFNHEMERPLTKDYETNRVLTEGYKIIYSKYMHRIDNFRHAIKEKTCFIRSIKDYNELLYIMENSDYINYVIKKANPENKIIYVIARQFTNNYKLDIPFYLVDHEYNDSSINVLRSLFDTNKELISFLQASYDKEKMKDNIIFGLRNELATMKISDIKYNLLVKVDNIKLDSIKLPDIVILYGIGHIGKIFYNKIKQKCKTLCFIDKSKNEEYYDNIPIITPHELIHFDNNATIIVTVTYEYNNIVNQLHKFSKFHLNIKSLDEIL